MALLSLHVYICKMKQIHVLWKLLFVSVLVFLNWYKHFQGIFVSLRQKLTWPNAKSNPEHEIKSYSSSIKLKLQFSPHIHFENSSFSTFTLIQCMTHLFRRNATQAYYMNPYLLSFCLFCKFLTVHVHVLSKHSYIHVIIRTDDETRVVLETDANNKRDYINASFINVSKLRLLFSHACYASWGLSPLSVSFRLYNSCTQVIKFDCLQIKVYIVL